MPRSDSQPRQSEPQSALVLTENEWDDLRAIAEHYAYCTRWAKRDDHGYRPEQVAPILRQRELCGRIYPEIAE